MITRKATKVPELNGRPKLFTNNSSIALKNFNVLGSNNLKTPIRIANPIRLAIISSAELLQDADFNMESVSGIKSKLESLLDECSTLKKGEIDDLQTEDKWILSKTQSKIEEISQLSSGFALLLSHTRHL